MSDGRATRARTQRRLPVMLLGLIVIAGGALGVALWSQQQSQRTPVLVTDRALAPGEVVGISDFRSVPVAVGDVVVVPESALESLAGRTVVIPVTEGQLVSSSMFGDPTEIVPEGSVLVGAVLDPGRFPPSGLRAGDTVDLVHTQTDAEAEVIGSAEVFFVEVLEVGSAAGDVAVSLVVVDGPGVVRVSAAAAAGELSLVVR